MGTKYKGTLTEKAALNAYIALRRSANSISLNLNIHLDKNGLSSGQFGVLEALFHLGPLSQRELGIKLLSTKGNVTMILDNLQKRDLIQRVSHSDDRRISIIKLTAAGKKLITKIIPIHVDKITNAMSVLNVEEMRELKRLCKKLGISLQKE